MFLITAFSGTYIPTTSLGFRGPGVVIAGVSSRVSELGGASLFLFRLIDLEVPAPEFIAIELPDRLLDGLFIMELHEGEASWPTGLAITGHKYLHQRARLREKYLQFTLHRIVI